MTRYARTQFDLFDTQSTAATIKQTVREYYKAVLKRTLPLDAVIEAREVYPGHWLITVTAPKEN